MNYPCQHARDWFNFLFFFLFGIWYCGTFIDIDIEIDIVYLTGRTLSYGNGTSHRLDKQSLQDTPASLQMHQENKTTK